MIPKLEAAAMASDRRMEDIIESRVEAAVAAALGQLRLQQPAPVAAAAVNTVAVKIPEFWEADPDIWFYQAECAFNRARITVSHTKYEHVVMRLPAAVSISVRALLLGVTAETEDPYEQLKTRLIADFGKTRWQRAFSLLDHPDVGDRRPSRLMGDMLALLPAGEPAGTLFLAMYLRRLPASMRDHLATADFATPAEMAAHADLLWDARSSQSASAIEMPIAAISGRATSPRGSDRGRSPDRQRGQRGRGGGRGRGRGGRRQQTPGRICDAHKKYGAEAYSCFPPCTWQAEN
jgi:hypothetical protein